MPDNMYNKDRYLWHNQTMTHAMSKRWNYIPSLVDVCTQPSNRVQAGSIKACRGWTAYNNAWIWYTICTCSWRVQAETTMISTIRNGWGVMLKGEAILLPKHSVMQQQHEPQHLEHATAELPFVMQPRQQHRHHADSCLPSS